MVRLRLRFMSRDKWLVMRLKAHSHGAISVNATVYEAVHMARL